jgi:hypothetical protein
MGSPDVASRDLLICVHYPNAVVLHNQLARSLIVRLLNTFHGYLVVLRLSVARRPVAFAVNFALFNHV